MFKLSGLENSVAASSTVAPYCDSDGQSIMSGLASSRSLVAIQCNQSGC